MGVRWEFGPEKIKEINEKVEQIEQELKRVAYLPNDNEFTRTNTFANAKVTSAPTENDDVTNKQYVDGLTKLALNDNTEISYPVRIRNKDTFIQFVNKNITTSNDDTVVENDLLTTGISDFGACSLWVQTGGNYYQLPYVNDDATGFVKLVWRGSRFKIKSKNAGGRSLKIYGVITYCK